MQSATPDTPYAELLERFLIPNEPFLLRGATDGWRATRDWLDADGQLDAAALAAHFGDAVAPVVERPGNKYGDEVRAELPVAEWAGRWARGEPPGYLKDWHLVRQFPDYGAYETPLAFRDDWLNWWSDRQAQDDFRFVYAGPAGSWTPLHHDVFLSNSWSANVCGRKRWTLFAPEHAARLLDAQGELPADVRDAPQLAGVPRVEIEQGPGDALFVPSGWHHQVENLEPTVSINHNWFNAASVRGVHAFLRAELAAVEATIGHLAGEFDGEEEYRAHCQLMMRANSGIDMREWRALLEAKDAELAAGGGAFEAGLPPEVAARVVALGREAVGWCMGEGFSAHWGAGRVGGGG